jgi:hypothetical protein
LATLVGSLVGSACHGNTPRVTNTPLSTKQQNDFEYFRNRPLLVCQKRRYSKFAHEVLLYDSLTARNSAHAAFAAVM